MEIGPQTSYKYILQKKPTTEYSLPPFSDLPTTENGVHFRLIDSGTNAEWISLCIEVNEETRLDDLEECWHTVLEYRKWLKQMQGIALFGSNLFYWVMSEFRSRFKMSYSEIARLVNQSIAEQISLGGNFYGTPDRVKQMRKCPEACRILELCLPGMDEEERAGYITEGIKNAKDGKPIFDRPDYPVTGYDIRERIRQFQKKAEEAKQMQEGW